jgi:hypothetical protein
MIKIPPIPFSGGKQPARVEDWSAYAAQLYPPQPPATAVVRPQTLVTSFNKNSVKIEVTGQPTVVLDLEQAHDVMNKMFDLVHTMEIL